MDLRWWARIMTRKNLNRPFATPISGQSRSLVGGVACPWGISKVPLKLMSSDNQYPCRIARPIQRVLEILVVPS